MKRVLERATAAILIGFSLAACAPEFQSSQQGQAIQVLAPMADAQGHYSLNFFILTGIEDIKTLSGKFAQFFMSPRIVNKKLQGVAPRVRLIRKGDGSYIPGNEITQQLVAVYAHMQSLAQLDGELGAAGVNSWPRDVGVSVRVTGGQNNNAFYDGETDAMLFVPYNQNGLPIPVNGGILAHEHFHSLFYKLVLPESFSQSNVHENEELLEALAIEGLRQREQKEATSKAQGRSEIDAHSLRVLYNLVLLRGLNEGLADFWGWMYSGDPDFISLSLVKEGASRTLNANEKASSMSLPSPSAIERSLKFFFGASEKKNIREFAVGYAYQIATQFSRTFKRFADIYGSERSMESTAARRAVAKMILKTLPEIRSSIKSLGEKNYSASQFLLSFAAQVEDLKSEECDFLVAVLNNSSDSTQAQFECKNKDGWKITTRQSSPKSSEKK